jgi:dTDP-4-amino-4,6-dideoxygalactose transaminase
LPVTDHLHERLLCIPLYYDLSDDRIDGIAGIIRRSLGLGSTHHYAA